MNEARVAFMAGSVLAAAAAHAADWRLEPTARVSSAYTDNPRFLEEGDYSTAGAVGELGATVRRLTERVDFSLQPRVVSSRYREDESLDSDDQFLDARIRLTNERSQWDGSLDYAHDSTLTSELGSTGLVESNRRHHNLTASLGPTWMATERLSVGGQAYWLASSYEDGESVGLFDYEYRALSLFAGFATTEEFDLMLTAQGGELYVPEFDTHTRDATLRLMGTWSPTALWTIKASAGPAYVDAEVDSDNGVVFDLDIAREAERWSASLRAARDLAPTGRGVLTRRDRAVFSTHLRFTEYLSAGASAQWVRNQDLLPQAGGGFYEVDYASVDLNLSWRFSEHWSMTLATSGALQDSDTREPAENHRASLSFVWNGQPLAL